MTTFRPRIVKCVARHLFAFPSLGPYSCVRLFHRSLVSLSGCLRAFSDWSQASFFSALVSTRPGQASQS